MQNFSGSGMFDREEPGVQGLTAKPIEGRLGPGAELARLGLEMRTIDRVTHQRVAGMGEMHPDLMGAPGLELTGDEHGDRLAAPAIERLLHLPMGDGLAAALAHRHFLPRVGMAIDRGIDRALPPCWNAPRECHVAAPQRAGPAMIGELRAQRLMGRIVLGRDHQAGGVLVEPMHDAGPPDAADAGKACATVRDQRIDQRPGFVARRGMDDQPLRLVDDDEVVILVDNIERDGLAFRFGRARRGHVDCDRIPRGDMICGVANRRRIVRGLRRAPFCGRGSNKHLARENQRLEPRSRQFWTLNREDAVKAIDLVCQYLERTEPTSPAQLLLRRAQRLIDKNFLELVKELAPEALNEVAKIMGVDPDSVAGGGGGY